MANISNQANVPCQGQIHQKKKLKDLNLMDAFLFDASTEKSEDAEVIARAIVRRVMGYELQEITVESLLSACMTLNPTPTTTIFRNAAAIIRQRQT